LPIGFLNDVKNFTRNFSHRLNEIEELLTAKSYLETAISRYRGKLVIIKHMIMVSQALLLRGSGVNWDLRKNAP
jgi:NADH:ubiquinone oxidoreductase subunit D